MTKHHSMVQAAVYEEDFLTVALQQPFKARLEPIHSTLKGKRLQSPISHCVTLGNQTFNKPAKPEFQQLTKLY